MGGRIGVLDDRESEEGPGVALLRVGRRFRLQLRLPRFVLGCRSDTDRWNTEVSVAAARSDQISAVGPGTIVAMIVAWHCPAPPPCS